MAKNLADLWKEAGKLEKEGEDVAEFNESVAKLPYQLKDEFRQRQDPKLDQQINSLQSDTFGAAIKGLDMYKGISDPFARRNLAEMYQGGIESQWKNAVDERTRRQGVFADYIEKWTGLFGAEAARKQQIFQNKQATWDREKNLADTEENNRRWNIEQAQKGSGGSGSKTWSNQEITSTINTLKNNGVDWGTISNYLAEQGVDVVHKSYADSQLNRAFNPNFQGYEEDKSPTEQLNEIKLAEAKKKQEYVDSFSAKENIDKANYGENYWEGTKIKKKKNWWADPTLYTAE